MTQQTRPTNKARFETGDAPAESDYADLIDSFLSLADSSAQTVTAPIILSDTLGVGVKVSSARVSAANVAAATVSASTVTVTGDVSASGAYFTTLALGGNEVLAAGAGAGAEIYITATASTVVTSAFVFYPIDMSAAGVSGINAVEFTVSSNGSFEYTGGNAKRFLCCAALSMKRAAANDFTAGVRFAKNGTSIASSEQDIFIGAAGDNNIATFAIVSANPNDVFNIHLANTVPDVTPSTAATNILTDKLTFTIVEVG